MYVITGAAGQTGKAIALSLLAAGKKVRALVRHPEKVEDLKAKGAEISVGSLDDASFLVKAFEGATAAYLLIPPNPTAPDILAYQSQIGEAQVKALREACVKYVVHLSSMGAHTPIGTGPVAGLFYQERRLNKLPETHVLHLRPTYFMENMLVNIGMIKGMGIIGGPLSADINMSFIATRDIAAYAAKRLSALDFSGKEVQELIGEKNTTPGEFAKVLAQAIGKPDLAWVQFPYNDAYQAMVGMGLSPSMAQSYIDLSRKINEGGYDVIARDKENTTPTSIENFAKTEWAGAFNAS